MHPSEYATPREANFSALTPNTRLRRRETAQALNDAGFPVSEKTLATKASRGGGPPFQSFGRIPLYRWGDALAWAEGRLSPLRANTSDTGTVDLAQNIAA